MKPSHLAAFVMAGLGLGGMSSAAMSAPFAVSQGQYQQQQAKVAFDLKYQDIFSQMQRAGNSNGAPPGSYRKKNQRQIRLARRRSHAAGNKKAFC